MSTLSCNFSDTWSIQNLFAGSLEGLSACPLVPDLTLNNLYGRIPDLVAMAVPYVGFFLITWYSLVLLSRLVLKFIWPLFLFASAVLVLHFVIAREPEELIDGLLKIVYFVAKILGFMLYYSVELLWCATTGCSSC